LDKSVATPLAEAGWWITRWPGGRALDYRNVGGGFRRAVKAAGLHAPGKLTLHSLRHTFASFLIASGLDVVFVSRQLGHAHPGITLHVYSHLFAARDHAATAREALDASHRAINGTDACEAAAVETAVETAEALRT
jgi:integrase